MSARELVVLGTSSQVPTRYRNHNGYLLLWDGLGILFDPGEGTQRQMTRYGVRAHQLHHICITHFHGDHCLGLPGVIQRISLDEVPHPVQVHYPRSGQRFFERLRYASIYAEKGRIEPRPIEGPGAQAELPDATLSVLRLDHGVDAWGYRLEERAGWTLDPARLSERGLRGPIIGELKRHGQITHEGEVITLEDVGEPRPGQVVTFLMDTRPCPNAAELARGADLLICESTYLASEAREAREHRHMTAMQAGRLAAEAGARQLVLTHFSQRYPMDAPFAEEAGRHHDDVITASDGLRVPVPPRRG